MAPLCAPPPPHRAATAARPRVWGRQRVSAGQPNGAALRGYPVPRFLRRVAAQGGGRREPQD
eukprot:scaffold27359_cov53-Phaeocystis_antarctica.AAC.4